MSFLGGFTMRHDDDDDWDEDTGDDGSAPCPYCGEAMYEEAGYCSSCERWITREELPRQSLPAWMVIVILIVVAMLALSALRPF